MGEGYGARILEESGEKAGGQGQFFFEQDFAIAFRLKSSNKV